MVKEVALAAGAGSALPYLYSNGERTLLSWVEEEGDSLAKLRYSELKDGQWLPPNDILKGSDWFVNWADFPMILGNKGNLMTHVLKKSASDTYAYDVKLNLFEGDKTQWATNIPLNTDGTPTEHGFVSGLPMADGSFFVTWLDGRNTLEREDGSRGAMTLRTAEVSASGVVSRETEVDSATCDCCQTSAAMTQNGPVVVYRDRSEEEVRDISIVRQVNGRWTAPTSIHEDGWKIKGCPVNGPKAAARGNALVVAWFTAAGEKPMVKIAFSGNGGAQFDAPITISDIRPMGRVDVLMTDGSTALVSWMETLGETAEIKAVKVERNGKKSEPLTITPLAASRKTGFPQMELVGDRVYFAWTDFANDTTTIKTAYVPAKRF
ncbi:MAG: hypothetical protein WBN39_06400 [Flavobacteriaceae bacterium]